MMLISQSKLSLKKSKCGLQQLAPKAFHGCRLKPRKPRYQTVCENSNLTNTKSGPFISRGRTQIWRGVGSQISIWCILSGQAMFGAYRGLQLQALQLVWNDLTNPYAARPTPCAKNPPREPNLGAKPPASRSGCRASRPAKLKPKPPVKKQLPQIEWSLDVITIRHTPTQMPTLHSLELTGKWRMAPRGRA